MPSIENPFYIEIGTIVTSLGGLFNTNSMAALSIESSTPLLMMMVIFFSPIPS